MNELSFGPEAGNLTTTAPRAVEQRPAGEAYSVPIVMQYLRIAYRWKWLILGAIGLTLLIGILLTLLATPLYTASTRVEINRESSRIVNVEGIEPKSSAVDIEFYQTQYGLLKSRSLAERVVRDLRLADNQDFFTAIGGPEAFENASRGGGGLAGARQRRFAVATSILLGNIDISPLRGSRLVDIRWTSPDPVLSARVTNAWAAAFIRSTLDRRMDASAYARRFLEGRLEQLRGRLEQSERQLVGYASNEALINIPSGAADAQGRIPERSLTADSLAALNAELAQATADRVRAQSRLRGSGSGASGEALQNVTIGALRQRRAEAAAEYSRLTTQFEAEYPSVRALAAQIEQLDRAIAREEGRVQGALRNAYQDSLTRERTLSGQVEALKQSFLDQRRRSIQYNIFQRDVDTNRELYDGLLQRYKEIGVAGGVGTNNVSIVDSAQVPDRPSRPRPLLNILMSLMIGSVIGIVLALVREQIDETITDPSDLEKRIGLPLLGTIPRAETDDPRTELKDPKSNMTEAYLSVQTSLAFSTDHGIPKTLTVTSTRPAEGKSTTAYAIAYSIARNGARTLLVDGDMRSPSVHRDLGIENRKGLSTYLSGDDDFQTLLQRLEGEPFAVMTAGPQPPNAAELLRSGRLEKLIAALSEHFEYVVVDSPPVMGLADAPIIASRTEGTVYVVEARSVKARLARVALGRLRQSRALLLGTVLTKFEAKRAHYGYGYEYGYGYGSKKET